MTDEHYINSKEQVLPWHVFCALDPKKVCANLAKLTGKPHLRRRERRLRRGTLTQ